MPDSLLSVAQIQRAPLTLYLAAPRGFCAGVDRAIQIVELALAKFGAPVYVRHEIVHNHYVVNSLKAKGAVFVEELNEIPETTQPVIFSAHGVAKTVPATAKARNLFVLDATCPLVFKVHLEATRHYEQQLQVLLIGHAEHPEVVGTMGQLPNGAVNLVETVKDARDFVPKDPERLAYVTQTTLSVDDTAEIVAILKRRFPNIVGPQKEDICYATTNRQAAVKAIAPRIGCLLVVGSPQSSNSLRLVEVAEQLPGTRLVYLAVREPDIYERLVEARRASRAAVNALAGVARPHMVDARPCARCTPSSTSLSATPRSPQGSPSRPWSSGCSSGGWSARSARGSP